MKSQWLVMLLLLICAFGALTVTGLVMQAGAQNVVVDTGGWRYSDGYWNYWDPADKAWYYTDGRHWYTYGDNNWSVYNFDRGFGKAYVREGYTVPRAGTNIVLPNHRIQVKVR